MPQHLAKLPMRRLVPRGFVFIFVEKQHVQALCRQVGAAWLAGRHWGAALRHPACAVHRQSPVPTCPPPPGCLPGLLACWPAPARMAPNPHRPLRFLPQMRAWGYCYIENLTWVYLRPNHEILRLPSRYANASHLTLYMFRREGGRGRGSS